MNVYFGLILFTVYGTLQFQMLEVCFDVFIELCLYGAFLIGVNDESESVFISTITGLIDVELVAKLAL